jgi:methanogenic corrinoid protein MtbC1
MTEEEINLKEMPTEEILELMHEDLYDGLAEEIVEEVNELLSRDMGPYDVLTKGLVAGMDIVGIDFRDGILFVPEVLMAAKAMKAGMEILRPLLAETGAPKVGTMVIGTVKGDIHDIGKNLVAMMMEGAGLTVIDLGVDVDAEKFVEAAKDNQADVVALSALLTTTMPSMETTVKAIKEAGLSTKSIIGGAPVTEAYAKQIGADGHSDDAPGAVDLVRRLVNA